MIDKINSKCIFCNRSITDSPTREHIILRCLGGKTVTNTTICSVCNNELNSKVDVHLKNETLYIRWLLQLKNSKGSGTIELRSADSDKGKVYIDQNGNFIVQTRPFELKTKTLENEQMEMVISIKGGSCSEYIKNLNKTKNMIQGKYGSKALKSFEESIEKSIIRTEHYSQVLLNTKMGIVSYDCCRSAAKMLLIFWAYKTSNSEVQKIYYNDIKRVINGDIDYSRVSILIPKQPIEKMVNALENYLYVKSDSHGNVIGHFQLFGGLLYKIKIAKKTNIKDKTFLLSSYPFHHLKDEEKDIDREIEFEEYDELFFVNLYKFAPLVDRFIQQFMNFISYYREQIRIPKVIDWQMQKFQKQKSLDKDSVKYLKIIAQDLYEKLLPQKEILMQRLSQESIQNIALKQIIELNLQNLKLVIPKELNISHVNDFLLLILKDFFDIHEQTEHPFRDFQQ